MKTTTYNTIQIRRIIKNKNWETAFEPNNRQNIKLPNPFDMNSTTVINHLEQFNEWQAKWKSTEFSTEFELVSNDGKNVVFKSVCPLYEKKRNDFMKNMTWY